MKDVARPRRRIRRADVICLAVGILIGPTFLGSLVDSVRPDPEPRVSRVLSALAHDQPLPEPLPGPWPRRARAGAETNDSPAAGAPPALLAPITVAHGREVPLGRLIIPRLNLDTTFVNGVHDQALVSGPGHWPGTPLPGTAGNAVLSGHRTTFTAPFADLDLLQPGDVVTTGIGSQPGVEHRVIDTKIVPEAEYAQLVTAQPADPAARTVTLFACAPEGSRTHRIVVTAQAEPAT